MSKINRSEICKKTNGNCAYCNISLNGKFQIDHIIPQMNYYDNKNTVKDLNHVDNLFASCASCNNYKSTHSIDQFRKELSKLVERLNNTICIYKISKRFGTIIETQKPIIFYFETLIAEYE